MHNRKTNGDAVTFSDLTDASGYLKGLATGPDRPSGGTYTVDAIGKRKPKRST